MRKNGRRSFLQIPLVSICACMFLLVSSLGGMRGFEVVWTDLAALRYDLAYCEAAEDDSAVSWPIVERFKNWHGALDYYIFPLPLLELLSQGFNSLLGPNGLFDDWHMKFLNMVGLFGD